MAKFDHYPWGDKLPDATLDVSEEHYHEFFRTMFERQMIWKRRFLDQKPRPWTDDPIYAITNSPMYIVNWITIHSGRYAISYWTTN